MSNQETLALMGGTPIRTEAHPPYNTIAEAEIDAAIGVLKTGILSGFVATPGADFYGGKWVLALEQAFMQKFQCQHAVSVNSATSGLHAALAAAGVGLGDEVIVPPYSMSASATAVVMCGATPIFVDIEADTFCLNSALVAPAITAHTKAIMAVNLFGQAADLLPLRAIADQHGVCLIEDNAQAPAAQYQGHWTGTIGDMGVFSLNRHKTMQCGEGGVVVTHDARLAHRLQMVRNHGEAVLPEWHEDALTRGNEDIVGYNYRLTELQAAIAQPQLERLEGLNATRIELAEYLSTQLDALDYLSAAVIRPGSTHVYYVYPMRYHPEVLGISRDQFVAALQAEGMPVGNYVRPLFRLPLYAARYGHRACYQAANFPVVEQCWQSSMVITSICRPPLERQHIDEFMAAIKKIERHAKVIQTVG